MSEFPDLASLRRPQTPNTFLLAPERFCHNEKPDAVSPVFTIAPGSLFVKFCGLVAANARWRELLHDDDQLALRFVAVTGLLRFRDDIDARVLSGPDGHGAQLVIYSRSRVGYHDLGTNGRRVKALLDRLQR